jgi:DnaJ-domain-containing protein 1
MPPPEVLAAAAAVSAAQREQREQQEAEEMIGPPPPEIVAEVDLSTADARCREAARVLDVHARQEDAYEILGAAQDADQAALKKRYWKLSLMVHIPPHLVPPRSHERLTWQAER